MKIFILLFLASLLLISGCDLPIKKENVSEKETFLKESFPEYNFPKNIIYTEIPKDMSSADYVNSQNKD